jgi:hypothetical protein
MAFQGVQMSALFEKVIEVAVWYAPRFVAAVNRVATGCGNEGECR